MSLAESWLPSLEAKEPKIIIPAASLDVGENRRIVLMQEVAPNLAALTLRRYQRRIDAIIPYAGNGCSLRSHARGSRHHGDGSVNSTSQCEPSQKGLFFDAPQRHKV